MTARYRSAKVSSRDPPPPRSSPAAWAGIPLGGLLGGAAVAGVGLGPVLVATGVVYFLTTNLAGLRPEWREMDRHRGKGRAGPVRPAAPSDAPRSAA